jgi:integrase
MAFRTQENVDRLKLPAGKTEHWEFDERCRGLSVRLQGKARSWIVWYAVNGKRRKMKIGDVAGMKLEQARSEATEIVNAAKKGKDALAEREAAKAKSADTLRALIEDYLVQRAEPRQKARAYAETARNLLKTWAPLHAEPAAAITEADIDRQLGRIQAERGPSAAKNARVYLSAVYVWAMRRGRVKRNPMIATEAPEVPPAHAKPPDQAQLAAILRACGDDDFGRIVKLAALLGARREEIAGMRWSEIDDLERRLWTIPGHKVNVADKTQCPARERGTAHLCRTKNHLTLELPLPEQAIALLPERREGRDLVFGRGKGAFSGFSNCKARLDQRSGVTGWTLHGLRHAASTNLHEIGVEPHIVEAILNHQSGHKAGIAGRYNAAAYREQKRAALTRYADWLDQVISGESPTNVLPMRA